MDQPISQLTLSEHSIRDQLERMLAHAEFVATDKMRAFLRFVVEETLAGNAGQLKGFTIATEVYGRGEDFDAARDPVVRVQASRLRRAIERYYLVAGSDDPVRIDMPKGGYVPVFTLDSSPGAESAPADAGTPAQTGDSWPSILVLPFEDLIGDAETAYLGPGLATELCIGLGACAEFRVMLASAGAPAAAPEEYRPDFIVRGSVRRQGADAKIVVQLVSGNTGEQLWIDSLKARLDDVGLIDFQEQTAAAITAHIASAHGVIFRALSPRSEQRPGRLLTSYQSILKGYTYHQKVDAASYREAYEALQNAHLEDPDCGLVCTMLALMYVDNISMEFFDVRQTPLEEAARLARDGVRLEPRNQLSRIMLARVCHLEGELDAGIAEADAALALNPDSLLFMDAIGYMLSMLGDWDRGEALIREAIRRNPYYRVFVHYATWLNAFRRAEYERALAETRYLPGVASFWDPLSRAATLGQLGRHEESRAAIRELLALKPGFPERGRVLIGRYVKPPELQQRIIDGLAAGGLDLDAGPDDANARGAGV